MEGVPAAMAELKKDVGGSPEERRSRPVACGAPGVAVEWQGGAHGGRSRPWAAECCDMGGVRPWRRGGGQCTGGSVGMLAFAGT